jgi:hypothetical protein
MTRKGPGMSNREEVWREDSGGVRMLPTAYASPEKRTSGLAIASLVLGIVWLFWFGSIAAVVFGHIALGQIRRGRGAIEGRGLAVAGLVLGYIGVATLVGWILFGILLTAGTAPQ